jgi:TonB-dependent SusC/RagA subfamily outer membrane receptor
MIVAWMVEATVAGVLFALGAWVAQRAAALHRGLPLRWLWAAALGATVSLSAAWLVPSRVPGAPGAAASVPAPGHAGPVVRAPAFHLPAVTPGVERGAAAAWAAASLALAGLLLFAVARLRRERRDWTDAVVGGTPVALSPAMGPAAVGFRRPRIVLPRWVLALDERALGAIVAHERAHQRARDPALLLAGLAAVVLMPWNVGAWLAWRGLRSAVEFDCDERVLAGGVGRADYARILLGAWGRTRGDWLPSAALTRPSGLGSRVEHLMRPEPRRRYMKTLICTAAAALLVAGACDTPAPQSVIAPQADVSRSVVAAGSTDPLVIVDGVKQNGSSPGDLNVRYAVPRQDGAPGAVRTSVTVRWSTATDSARAAGVRALLAGLPPDQIEKVEVLKGGAATAQYGPDAKNGVIIITTKGDTTKN